MIDLVIINKPSTDGYRFYDEELADALIKIWKSRDSLTKEQRDRLLKLLADPPTS